MPTCIALQEVVFAAAPSARTRAGRGPGGAAGFQRGQRADRAPRRPAVRQRRADALPMTSERRICLDYGSASHARRSSVLETGGRPLRVWRRISAPAGRAPLSGAPILEHVAGDEHSVTVLLGDFNEWFLVGRPLRWLHARFGRGARRAHLSGALSAVRARSHLGAPAPRAYQLPRCNAAVKPAWPRITCLSLPRSRSVDPVTRPFYATARFSSRGVNPAALRRLLLEQPAKPPTRAAERSERPLIMAQFDFIVRSSSPRCRALSANAGAPLAAAAAAGTVRVR